MDDQRNCPKCGETVPPDEEACGNCGVNLPGQQSREESEEKPASESGQLQGNERDQRPQDGSDQQANQRPPDDPSQQPPRNPNQQPQNNQNQQPPRNPNRRPQNTQNQRPPQNPEQRPPQNPNRQPPANPEQRPPAESEQRPRPDTEEIKGAIDKLKESGKARLRDEVEKFETPDENQVTIHFRDDAEPVDCRDVTYIAHSKMVRVDFASGTSTEYEKMRHVYPTDRIEYIEGPRAALQQSSTGKVVGKSVVVDHGRSRSWSFGTE